MDVITQFFSAYLVAAANGCDTTAIRKALVDKADADTQTIFDAMTSWMDPDLNVWLAVCTVIKNIPDQPTADDLKWYRINLDQICHLRGMCLPPTPNQALQGQVGNLLESVSHLQETVYRLDSAVTSLVHGPPSPGLRISRSLSQAMDRSVTSSPQTPVSATPPIVLSDTNQFPALTTVFKPVVQTGPKRAGGAVIDSSATGGTLPGGTPPYPPTDSAAIPAAPAPSPAPVDDTVVSDDSANVSSSDVTTSPEINVVILPATIDAVDAPAAAPKPARKNRSKKQSPERGAVDRSLSDAFEGIAPKRGSPSKFVASTDTVDRGSARIDFAGEPSRSASASPIRVNGSNVHEKINSVIGYIYDSFARCGDQARIDSPYGVVQKLKRSMADPARADAIDKLMTARASYHDIIAAL